MRDYEALIIAQGFYTLASKYDVFNDPQVTQHIQIGQPQNGNGDDPAPWSNRVDRELFHIEVQEKQDSGEILATRITFPEFDGKYGQLHKDLVKFLQVTNLYDFNLVNPIDTSKLKYCYYPGYEPY